jgi:hypothetical protein
MDPTESAKERFSEEGEPSRPGWWKTFRKWLASSGEDGPREEVVEATSDALPDFLSGKSAVRKNRKRLQEIDAIR